MTWSEDELRLGLLFGFLGSGKTTLARRILESRPQGVKLAVIVNEFGDVGIDGAILSGSNIDLIELTSGCLCCTLKGPLLQAVEELRARAQPNQIIIEATGVAEPDEMIETFSSPDLRSKYDFAPLVTVVDAANFSKLVEILGDFYTSQITHCDAVVLNKIDLGAVSDLQQVQQRVYNLNPDASVYFAERCDIDAWGLLSGPSSRVMKSHLHGGSGGHHAVSEIHHAPAQSFVLDAARSASRSSVERFFNGLPTGVWRAKGFMIIDARPMLIQYTSSGLEFSPTATRKHMSMVFIGRDMDRSMNESQFAAISSPSREL